MPPTKPVRYTVLSLALQLLLVHVLVIIEACRPSSSGTTVTIGDPTYVCLVINDRNITVWTPTADDYVRLVVQGSFNATRLRNACLTDKFWFPQGCPNTGELPLKGVGGPPATNFYVSSMGVSSDYKKSYAYINYAKSNGPITVSSWFPIVTAVIQVSMGVVTSVYWDDGCYYCPWSQVETPEPDLMTCVANYFGLDNGPTNLIPPLTNTTKRTLDPANHNGFLGSDCRMSASACTQGGTGKTGFCDLGVYVVWTGTDTKGHQFASAGRRFRRFRQYYMQPQFEAMQRFGGNNINSQLSITDNTLVGPSSSTTTSAPSSSDGSDPYG